jgi:hypothetical protein
MSTTPALTVCQPYAHLIARGEKRVENRKWPTDYRGPLLIHAGKSREWLNLDPTDKFDEFYGVRVEEMAFGAIVAKVYLFACLPIQAIKDARKGKADFQRLAWLFEHEHTEGPWCLVLGDLWVPDKPIPYRGAQGIFEAEGISICAAGSPSNLAGLPAWRKVRQCRICGCVDEYGCPNGCEWVGAELCSECVKWVAGSREPGVERISR